jgi:hypothetical protein
MGKKQHGVFLRAQVEDEFFEQPKAFFWKLGNEYSVCWPGLNRAFSLAFKQYSQK